MNLNPRLELSEDEMRVYASKITDHIIEYYKKLSEMSPVSISSREEMDSILMEDIPENPSSPIAVLDEIFTKILTHTDLLSHPKFYSFVPSASNFISVMVDSLATSYNIFTGIWTGSPAGTEVELVTSNWLLKLFGFPVKEGGGFFTSGGSMANLTAIATARHEKCGEDFQNATIYMSSQAHSSNRRAARILGFTSDQIRIIPVKDTLEFDLGALHEEIKKDLNLAKKPFCVIASAGTTNTGYVDPLFEIAKICRVENLWMHVDAAYGGGAILSSKGKKLLSGIELADSITVDPHKWFFQPYEIGCILVRDNRALSGTFSENPEYLRDTSGNAGEVNFHNFGIQLTRRARALKFYASIKTFGLSSFRAAVDYSINLTEKVEIYIEAQNELEILSPASLAILNFRFNPGNLQSEEINEINQEISKEIIRTQEAMLVTTTLNDNISLRMCLINPRTQFEMVKQTIDKCIEIGNTLLLKH